MKKVFLLLSIAFLFSCTQNGRAKKFGGTATLDVPCDQKVINITWKSEQLWYSTVPMEFGYEPQIHTFREESSFGVMEGKYILKETRCN